MPMVRAFELLGLLNHVGWCKDCHPLIMPPLNKYQLCSCDAYERYVGERWLCIPWFFDEEVKTLTARSLVCDRRVFGGKVEHVFLVRSVSYNWRYH